MIRILIVDDQPSVREGLQMLLAAESDLSVVGEASDGDAALELGALLSPQVILMDVEMPRMDGIAATHALRAICPDASVIILSMHDDEATRAKAALAGAAAFVSKSTPPVSLLSAIRKFDQSSWNAPVVPESPDPS